VDPRAGLEDVEKILYPTGARTPTSSVVQPVASRSIEYAIPATRLLPKNIKLRIHKTVIMPLILYGCETWSLTLRGKHRLRESDNRVLRRIFGPKRDEVTGDWTRLHGE
jgi:hypothetical protein